ncbi:MAG: polysaccharide biosynthesis protein [uncultured bacterium]|nr:MAG: polysaccharide biosynthesis protein [uncultured bacterium]HBD05588.1 hypothetical protein [Candidatus Uhrbacteria bacterium]
MHQSIAKNTAYLTISYTGQKILAFVYFMFIARILNVDGVGAYFLSLSIPTVFSVFADFGLQPVIVREIARERFDVPKLIRSSIGLKLFFILASGIASIGTSLALGYDKQIINLVSLATIVMALDSIHLTIYGVLRGQQLLKYESAGIFIGMILTVVFGSISLIVNPSISMLMIALMIGSLWNVVWSIICAKKIISLSFFIPRFDVSIAKKLLKTALPFALAGAFVKGYSYIDTILISLILGGSSVGIYAIPYKITYAFQFIPMAFIAALYPGMSALVEQSSDKLKEVFSDSMWYMAVLAFPISFGIWAIAPEIVTMLAGPNFYESVAPLKILIFATIFLFLDFPIGSILNAADKQGTKTAIMGFTMLINVAANALLIPKLNVIGACVSAIISFIVLFVLGMHFARRTTNYSFMDLLRMIIPVAFSSAIMAGVVLLLKQYMNIAVVILIGSVLYIIFLKISGSLQAKHIKHISDVIRRYSNKNRYEEDINSNN